MQSAGVALYLSAHDHQLQHIEEAGGGGINYVVSGGGTPMTRIRL
jgi:hypothetical protein